MTGCISLEGSTQCPAWQSASISTNVSFEYSFLQYVSDRASFDSNLASYVQTAYVQEQFVQRLGCQGINLKNTSELYPRYLKSTICSSIVQSSASTCGLSTEVARPLCADSCADFAESEFYLVADTDLCANASSAAAADIRADFTTCSLPDNSLNSSSCISGSANEPDNCGYGNSTIGLCSYCTSNSTDTCCNSSDSSSQCSSVVLPSITATITFGTSTPTATSSGNATVAGTSRSGVSKGAIAGAVVGSVAGVALLAALLFAVVALRRRKGSQDGSIFNQPSPARKTMAMAQVAPVSRSGNQPLGVNPGGRIARMSALEEQRSVNSPMPPERRASTGHLIAAAAVGHGAGSMSRRQGDDRSSSDGYNDSPGSGTRSSILRPPPMMRRNGSLSSGSLLVGEDPQSPSSAGVSSPQAMTSQQSEQLPFFKDYYSQDDIHPGDQVSVLWAYQPRAADEFTLERGDMLKVVGIWDDGWATGVMMEEHADEWDVRRQMQRDSGVSNTSDRGRVISPAGSGEIKAFPLVCVCLPEHWRKTIEGDGTTDTTLSGRQGTHGS